MAERIPAAMSLRDAERREIERQVKAFLDKGGKIEQVPLRVGEAKPVGRAWHNSISAGLDSL